MEDGMMDIDIDLDPEIARLQAGSAALNALPSAMEADNDNTTGDVDADNMIEDGEVAATDAVANKVHISGLGTLNTSDIANFASDTHQADKHVKIEWINDDSANIVYKTDAAGAAALKSFSTTPTDDPLEFRRAPSLITHPDVELWVRQALVTDVKVQGAAQQSRFYLTHPELDPENRPRNRGGRRGGGRGGRGGYRRSGGHLDEWEERPRRRSSTATAEKPFTVDMYDDTKADSAPTGPRRGRQSSTNSGEDLIVGRQGGRDGRRRPTELMGDRRDGRLRDRSASPMRDGDGRYGFSDDQPHRQTARHRTPPPARTRSSPDNRSASKALREDLFKNRKSASALQNGNGIVKKPIELIRPHPPKDLFPDMVNKPKKDLMSTLDRRRPQHTANRNGGDLITHTSNNHGRLTDDYDDGGGSFSIKGAGSKNDFSFRGAGSGRFGSEKDVGGRDLFEGRSRQSTGQRLDSRR